jgi:2-phospho-L-lactate guanylyltransferase
MVRDTVEAVRATAGVVRVIVLWDDVADAGTVSSVEGLGTTGQGLNDALASGAAHVRHDAPDVALAVVPGDLPALDPAELSRCLAIAGGHRRAFLPDADGTGTTILTATGRVDLAPAYGRSSTLAHAASGAHLIDPVDLLTVRADVDDLASLARALGLGRGDHTRAVCEAAGLLTGAGLAPVSGPWCGPVSSP